MPQERPRLAFSTRERGGRFEEDSPLPSPPKYLIAARGRQCLSHEGSGNTQDKGSVLATNAVETQDKGSALRDAELATSTNHRRGYHKPPAFHVLCGHNG